VISIIGNNKDNTQIKANMNVVHNILNGGSEDLVAPKMELAVAA